MYQICRWVAAMRERGNQMMIIAAPFEADAQLVQVSLVFSTCKLTLSTHTCTCTLHTQLERQNLIDCILAQDGDIILFGAVNVQHGFNTRGSAQKKYFRKRFPSVKGDTTMNRWCRCPRSKAACAAFLGTDYNTPLWGVNLSNGSCKRMG
jgi:hypothetical protein